MQNDKTTVNVLTLLQRVTRRCVIEYLNMLTTPLPTQY